MPLNAWRPFVERNARWPVSGGPDNEKFSPHHPFNRGWHARLALFRSRLPDFEEKTISYGGCHTKLRHQCLLKPATLGRVQRRRFTGPTLL